MRLKEDKENTQTILTKSKPIMISNLNTSYVVSYNMGIMTGDHDIGERLIMDKRKRLMNQKFFEHH